MTEKRISEEDLVRAAKRKDRITRWGWRIAGYVFFLGIWELASGRLMDEKLLPGPSTVFRTFGELWATGEVPGAFATTLTRIAIGFSIAFVVGVGIGILMQNRFLNGFFRDAVTIGVTTPGLIWALITAIIFGNRTDRADHRDRLDDVRDHHRQRLRRHQVASQRSHRHG